MPPRVLVAFDKFKDALTAPEACTVAAAEIRRMHPDWVVDTCPLTDGGDGFCDVLTTAARGTLAWTRAAGPRLEPRDVAFGFVETRALRASARRLLEAACPAAAAAARIAVVEMAAINGLALVPPEARDPWHTSTAGTGQLLRAAAAAGAGMIVLGIGGSATHDLGLGALQALGLRFVDLNRAPVESPIPAAWDSITAIEGIVAGLPPLAIACDVENPLLGPGGAASVYAPQKGLRPGDLPRLESGTRRMAAMLAESAGCDVDAAVSRPGAGAAGGLGFGLAVAAGADFVPGSAFVHEWLGIGERLAQADILITGEGRWDASSLSGKGPGAIVREAQARGGIHTIVFAGAIEAAASGVPAIETIAITPPDTPLATALAQARDNLAAAVRRRFA